MYICYISQKVSNYPNVLMKRISGCRNIKYSLHKKIQGAHLGQKKHLLLCQKIYFSFYYPGGMFKDGCFIF